MNDKNALVSNEADKKKDERTTKDHITTKQEEIGKT